MQGKAYGDECRVTTVCIDSYRDGILEGRLYNPSFKGGKPFFGLAKMLLEIENLLDGMSYPQSFTAIRAFSHAPPKCCAGVPPREEVEKGKLATFAVRILFRQNASWQGSVSWLEGEQSQSFRSALELIFLINSALAEKQPPAEKVCLA